MSISFSKTADECRVCEHFDDCNKKRMVACAFQEKPPEQLFQPVAAGLTAPLAQDVLVKHDYRNIKIAENTTITIDLEDVKKKLKEDFYKQINCNFMQYGG